MSIYDVWVLDPRGQMDRKVPCDVDTFDEAKVLAQKAANDSDKTCVVLKYGSWVSIIDPEIDADGEAQR